MFFAFFDLDFVLGGNEHFQNIIGQVHRVGPLFQAGGDFVLVAGISVDHVPIGLRLTLRPVVDDQVVVFFGHI